MRRLTLPLLVALAPLLVHAEPDLVEAMRAYNKTVATPDSRERLLVGDVREGKIPALQALIELYAKTAHTRRADPKAAGLALGGADPDQLLGKAFAHAYALEKFHQVPLDARGTGALLTEAFLAKSPAAHEAAAGLAAATVRDCGFAAAVVSIQNPGAIDPKTIETQAAAYRTWHTAKIKAAAEDIRLADTGDVDAAARALKHRIRQIAGDLAAGRPSPGDPAIGALDAPMKKWADNILGQAHRDGLVTLAAWHGPGDPLEAAMALILLRELAPIHPELALKPGESKSPRSASGWNHHRAEVTRAVGPARIAQLDKAYTGIFTQKAAQNSIGTHLLHGRYGYPKDPARAYELIRAAAEAGDSHACFNLALAYEHGVAGVPPKNPQKQTTTVGGVSFVTDAPPPDLIPEDLELAKSWYAKAVAQGNADAEKNRKALLDAERTHARNLAWARQVDAEYTRIGELTAKAGQVIPLTPEETAARGFLSSPPAGATERRRWKQALAVSALGNLPAIAAVDAEQLVAAGKFAEVHTALRGVVLTPRGELALARAHLDAPVATREHRQARTHLKKAVAELEPGAALTLGRWFADTTNPQRVELRSADPDEPLKTPAGWPAGPDWDAALWYAIESRWTRDNRPSLHAEAAEAKLTALNLPADARATLDKIATRRAAEMAEMAATRRADNESFLKELETINNVGKRLRDAQEKQRQAERVLREGLESALKSAPAQSAPKPAAATPLRRESDK